MNIKNISKIHYKIDHANILSPELLDKQTLLLGRINQLVNSVLDDTDESKLGATFSLSSISRKIDK